MNASFPVVALTGGELSLRALAQPDERITRFAGLTIEGLQAPYLHLEARLSPSVPGKLRERITVTRNVAVYGYFVYEFHAVSMFWSMSCMEMALKMKFSQVNPDPITVTRGASNGSEESRQIPIAKLQAFRRETWRFSGMKDFDYSFRSLLAWAFREKLLPEDMPIPMQEIVNSYNTRFMLEIFPDRAVKDGLRSSFSSSADITECWNTLSEAQRKHYQSKGSTILVEELPRYRNMMAHPEHFDLVVFPNAPVGSYELLIDLVSRLWP